MGLEQYGIYSLHLKSAISSFQTSNHDPYLFIQNLLREDNVDNGLSRALLELHGKDGFIKELSVSLKVDQAIIENALQLYLQESPIVLTGAEAVALIMMQEGVKNVFAYAGTSELALCNAVARVPGLNLINGRGDKESAFMAAGGSLLVPTSSVAILHGARGLTNALGAIADVRRNEIGTVFFVGLPSLASLPFLPPHGEPNLISNLSGFVKEHYEAKEFATPIDTPEEIERKSFDFVKMIKTAFVQARSLPIGPILIGLPQDVLEKRWIVYNAFSTVKTVQSVVSSVSDQEIQDLSRMIKGAQHPLILIDDFLFKHANAKDKLVAFASAIEAPILQIRYSRGAMFFESISTTQNPYFVDLYHLDDKWHRQLMRVTDLLIILEDRNAYPRVVGKLPQCQKVVLTSNLTLTRKNGYLTFSDLVIEGDVVDTMARTLAIIREYDQTKDLSHIRENTRREISTRDLGRAKVSSKYDFLRVGIAEELAKIFEGLQQPLVVDDSQMFGAILMENYGKFPPHLRVFGDHGGFVGAGIAYSTGLALVADHHTVFCMLGDQGFTNGLQGLIAASQERAQVIYIVCNNGGSVSLIKQISSEKLYAFDGGHVPFLQNSPTISYTAVAKELGISTFKVVFDPENSDSNLSNPRRIFREILSQAIELGSPTLVELRVPSDQEAWLGIWATKGNEG